MKTVIQSALLCLFPMLLAACGGSAPADAPPAPPPVLAATVVHSSSGDQISASAYYDMVQHIYVAYFGRPADPGGLEYYARLYLQVGAPTDVVALASAYFSNPLVPPLIDSFGSSPESQALYSGDNEAFVTAIYNNLFNRDPDPGGRAYWGDKITSGALTRGNAALAIMAGAQSTDMTGVSNKSAVASAFTTALNTPLRQAGYTVPSIVPVRAMIGSVLFSTDVSAFQGTVEATVASLASSAGASAYVQAAAIIHSRCVGCHSAHPTIAGFSPAPLGIKFDSSAEIHANAALINANAVQSQFMPYGNITGMSSEERAVLGNWIALGAP